MLNIIKKEQAKKQLEFLTSKFKHFPSSVREWNNSLYFYNKNSLNLIPSTTMSAMKLIKSFFSAYNLGLERKLRSKRLLLRLRRLSSNRIYLSKGEFKHKNNSVLINIYIFNRQKHNYLAKLKNIFLKNLTRKGRKGTNRIIIKTLKSILEKGLVRLKQVNKHKYRLKKLLNIIKKNRNYKFNTFKALSAYTVNFYKKLIKLTMRKLRLYFLYKQLIYINKSKLNYTYLRLLKKHLENLYNKNVEFNLINLDRFYLNSNILVESLKLKLTRKRKLWRKLNKLKRKVKVNKIKWFIENLATNTENEVKSVKYLESFVFSSLKYKHVTGFRLEAKGRLSKRFTASRSVSKLTYKGNLINFDPSYRRLSSVMLKGNLKPNIQYTKLSSKTRIGSFGLKGWVSGN